MIYSEMCSLELKCSCVYFFHNHEVTNLSPCDTGAIQLVFKHPCLTLE